MHLVSDGIVGSRLIMHLPKRVGLVDSIFYSLPLVESLHTDYAAAVKNAHYFSEAPCLGHWDRLSSPVQIQPIQTHSALAREHGS
jgi:hypothetical protein